MARNALAINHLLYVDDLMLAGRANMSSSKAVWDCFNKFCCWSGQRMNREKSSILFSEGLSRENKRHITELWGIRGMKKNSIYLGNSLILGRNKSKEFARLNDRIQARLEAWQSKLFSKAGKTTLIKVVVQAIPVYTMSTFKVSKGICDDLDAMVRRFWWGTKSSFNRFLALKPWKEICQCKERGGLGFKQFKDINSALLSKLGWLMAKGDNRLWVEVLRKKYLKGNFFFACNWKKGDLMVWKGILSTKEIIR